VLEPEGTYAAPITEGALLAAAVASECGSEMTPGIQTNLDAALRALTEATYEWTNGLD
jgi:hypothetical protein